MAKARRRLVVGLRQVGRQAALGNLKAVVLAYNLEAYGAQAGGRGAARARGAAHCQPIPVLRRIAPNFGATDALDRAVAELLDTCAAHGTPVVTALSRRRLGASSEHCDGRWQSRRLPLLR